MRFETRLLLSTRELDVGSKGSLAWSMLVFRWFAAM